MDSISSHYVSARTNRIIHKPEIDEMENQSRTRFYTKEPEPDFMFSYILFPVRNVGMDRGNKRLSRGVVCASEKLEDVSTAAAKWEEFVKELKVQWKIMWRDRVDDRVRAEGIASEDYSLLFLKRGTVIIATRKYRPPDLMEILEHYRGVYNVERKVGYVNPVVGGWTKFIRDVLKRQPRFTRRKMREPPRFGGKEKSKQQKKKGGRGWVHRF